MQTDLRRMPASWGQAYRLYYTVGFTIIGWGKRHSIPDVDPETLVEQDHGIPGAHEARLLDLRVHPEVSTGFAN